MGSEMDWVVRMSQKLKSYEKSGLFYFPQNVKSSLRKLFSWALRSSARAGSLNLC